LDDEAYWERHDDLTTGELIRAQDALAEKEHELAVAKLREEDAKQEAAENKRKIAKGLKEKGMPVPEIARLVEMTEKKKKKI
jgi:predicted ATP-grasp superfamily ATP-dependent carboligase